MNIKLIEGNLTHVSFNWSQISSQCPSIQYHIVASNCGECPDITINNKVTCTGKYTQLINSHQCSFAVQTIVCDEIIGDISTAINVTVSRSGIWSNYELSSLDEVCIQGL